MLVPSTTLTTWHRRRERKWRLLLYILLMFGLAILAKADAVVPWIDLIHPRSAVLSCRDSIILRWSRPLASLPSHSRGLVQVSSGGLRIAQDDSTIVIEPPHGGWHEDVTVVEADVSALTGVSTDARRWSFPLRRAMWVNCIARCEGHIVAPDIVARCVESLSTTVTTGGPVPIAAPDRIGTKWRFREWRFRDSAIMRQRDDHIIVIEAPCWEIRDTVEAVAVYDMDTVENALQDEAEVEVVDNPDDGENPPVYRLRIEIQDADRDVRFDATEGLTIDPARAFEDDMERTQSVCVRASQCWEIVGFVDRRGRTTFTSPQREHCATWELEHPTNVVRYVLQRRSIRLRIDRLCKSSTSDVGYDPHCRPHADGTVNVCLERKAHGFTIWVPIQSEMCSSSTLDSREWLVRCGDRLRIAVREQPMREVHWYGWMTSDRYPRPEYVGYEDGAHWYEMLVQMAHAYHDVPMCGSGTGDYPAITMRALFDQGLVVESVALRVCVDDAGDNYGLHYEEREFDALRLSALSPGEPADGRQLEYLPGKGTSVVVRFSRPVDLATVNAGGLAAASYDNVHPRFPDRSTSFETRSQFDERLVIRYDAPGVAPRSFEFFMMDPTTVPRKQALYMGEILLEAAASLRATDGRPMARRQQFVLSRVEYPGAAIRLLDVAIGGAETPGEHLAMVQGFSATANASRNYRQGFRLYPECDVDDGCVLDVDKRGVVDMQAAFAVFESSGLRRTEELHAMLWSIGCGADSDVSPVRNAAREVLARSIDVLLAQYANGRAIPPVGARQAVYHAARVDLESTHGNGIETLHWSFVDIAAERLRRPIRVATGGAVPWTYDVRLYPRKAVLD